jgi:hypothetical protein
LRSGASSTRSLSASWAIAHLHDADRACDHLPASGEDRLGPLAAQHHLGNLGRVGEVGQACLQHLDPGGLAWRVVSALFDRERVTAIK